MGGYSLPLKNRDMFRDLKKGFQVYTLDTSDVPVFRMGNVVNVSEPRFQQPQMGQMGQYQQLQDRVIDLTVEINGSSMTYVVPESRDVAMSNNITLACSVDPIMNQLNAAKRTSSDILDSIDTTLENPVGNRIPIGFLFDRSLIMITFVRGRSFVHRKGGRE